MAKYTIGVDFGTLSGRALLVDTSDGSELANSEFLYPHAVMETALPDGTLLGQDWALQHPQDYIDVLHHTIPAVIQASGVKAEDIVGISVDFTACTFMPIKADGTPLCFLEEYKNTPHAYIKLWKHHAAQEQANRLNALAHARKEPWIERYGGKISSEWQVPKVLQLVEEAEDIYNATDYFIEATDWITAVLCGKITKSECTAGYKGIWNKKEGYPSNEFFKALDSRLANYVDEKLNYPFVELGQNIGTITPEVAAKTGLSTNTVVATANVDAHVTVPALGISEDGSMLAIIGTSTCHIMIGKTEGSVPGICGVVDGGVYPGFYGYEAGQSCVGDHFAWFVNNCVPAHYFEEAKKQGKNIHLYLREKAQALAVGESGLIALDWWNGNRSVLVDVDLTGLFIGMTLQTTPEELYRALIEATAYGTRLIVDTFAENDVPVNQFFASGGISQKDPMMMQIYADVLNMPIKIAASMQGPALGSAIFAALAAGVYEDIGSAAQKMGKVQSLVYKPNPQNNKAYTALYEEYKTLHDYFGRGANDVMKRLKTIRAKAKGE